LLAYINGVEEGYADDEYAGEFEDEFGEDLADHFDEAGIDATNREIDRLKEALEQINARILWLESLKENPVERVRLGGITGMEITPQVLEEIIQGARTEAEFIKDQIEILENGVQAMKAVDTTFVAEVGHPENIDTVQYGPAPFYRELNDSLNEHLH